jgi:beta-galactosidase
VEPFQADHRKAFSGMALVIVRSRAGQAGRIRVTASSSGLTGAAAEINAR